MCRHLGLALVLIASAAATAAEPFRFPEAKHGKGELKYIRGCPVLLVEGTPEEIGEQTAVLIRSAANGVTGYLKSVLKRYNAANGWPHLVKAADGMLKQFPPDHLKEMQSACKVFGVDQEVGEAVLIGNCLWDIGKLGCSTLTVQPERSATGQPIFGRNFDFPGLDTLHEYSLLVIARPKGKRAFASITFPGLVGCMSGMNDAGLAIATLDVETSADGSPKFDVTGTPMLLTFRRILEECATVADAEKLLREARRTTSLNLAVCDRQGGVVFEMTPKTLAVRRPDEGLCCCTNHFRCKGLATITECDRYLTLTKTRATPKVGVADVAHRLHLVNQGQWTIQTMIFEPASLRLRLALGKGPVSDKELQVFELAPLFKHGPLAAAHLEEGFR